MFGLHGALSSCVYLPALSTCKLQMPKCYHLLTLGLCTHAIYLNLVSSSITLVCTVLTKSTAYSTCKWLVYVKLWNFCTQFGITLKPVGNQCQGQRKFLTVQLNARLVRRIDLCKKVCTVVWYINKSPLFLSRNYDNEVIYKINDHFLYQDSGQSVRYGTAYCWLIIAVA